MTSIDNLMLIPESAKDRYQKAMKENQELESTLEAQCQIIKDLSNSFPNITKISKEISDVNMKIKEISEAIEESQSALITLLKTDVDDDSSSEEQPLKTVLDHTLDELSKVALDSVNKGELSVSVLDIIDVEEQIANTINDLENRGLFKETIQGKNARLEQTQNHVNILTDFFDKVINTQT